MPDKHHDQGSHGQTRSNSALGPAVDVRPLPTIPRLAHRGWFSSKQHTRRRPAPQRRWQNPVYTRCYLTHETATLAQNADTGCVKVPQAPPRQRIHSQLRALTARHQAPRRVSPAFLKFPGAVWGYVLIVPLFSCCVWGAHTPST